MVTVELLLCLVHYPSSKCSIKKRLPLTTCVRMAARSGRTYLDTEHSVSWNMQPQTYNIDSLAFFISLGSYNISPHLWVHNSLPTQDTTVHDMGTWYFALNTCILNVYMRTTTYKITNGALVNFIQECGSIMLSITSTYLSVKEGKSVPLQTRGAQRMPGS